MATALVAGVLLVGAFRWYQGYTPPEIKGLNSPAAQRPASPSEPVAEEDTAGAAPETAEPPTVDPAAAEPVASRRLVAGRRSGAVGVGFRTPAQPVTAQPEVTMAAESAAATPAPSETEAPPERMASQRPTDSEILERKVREYRAAYGPAKARVEQLEREVAELSEKGSRFIGGGNDGPVIEADAVHRRLGDARDALDRARAALADLEERARRDGVSYGQLY